MPLNADRWRFLDERREVCRRRFDAACGTRTYWATLLEAGLEVVGTDQSLAMLDVAGGKHPEVTVHRVALQDLAAAGPTTTTRLSRTP